MASALATPHTATWPSSLSSSFGLSSSLSFMFMLFFWLFWFFWFSRVESDQVYQVGPGDVCSTVA